MVYETECLDLFQKKMCLCSGFSDRNILSKNKDFILIFASKEEKQVSFFKEKLPLAGKKERQNVAKKH